MERLTGDVENIFSAAIDCVAEVVVLSFVAVLEFEKTGEMAVALVAFVVMTQNSWENALAVASAVEIHSVDTHTAMAYNAAALGMSVAVSTAKKKN